MNVTTTITVHGTMKSEQAGGLDSGESSTFTIAPGQYSPDVSTPMELIEHVSRSAYLRGEWIASLRIGSVDVVHAFIGKSLIESGGDLDNTVLALSEEGMFCNADPEDLRSLAALVARTQTAR